MDKLTNDIDKLTIHKSENDDDDKLTILKSENDDDEIIITVTQEEVWSAMMVVLEDISLNMHDELDIYDEVINIIPEITSYFSDNGFKEEKISRETDRILLSLIDEHEYLIRCFRYYFCDCIKTDSECAESFKIIKDHVNNNSEFLSKHIDITNVNSALENTIKFLNKITETLDFKNLIIINELPLYISYDIRHDFFDAYEFLNFTLDM